MVNLAIIGAQKSGTKALVSFLRSHPEINFGRKEEIHFFDDDSVFKNNKVVDLDRYHNNFDFTLPGKYFVDVTPSYLYWTPSIERIHNYNPKIKMICILRNPVDRAYSHWNMDWKRNRMPNSFLLSILMEIPKLIQRKLDRTFSILSRGFYFTQLSRLLHYFPMEQCLILNSTQLKDHHHETMIKIYNFLQIDDTKIPPHKIVHHRKCSKPMNRMCRFLLLRIFIRDIKKLEKLLQWDLQDWRS